MKTPLRRSAAGFSLVEVALALGVAAFCLVTIFGLLPIGVNTNRASFEQTAAANVASAVVADLRAVALTTPPVDQITPYYKITVPGAPAGSAAVFTTLFVRQDGTPSGTVDHDADPGQNPRYRVTLYFTPTTTSTAAGHLNATTVRLLITWPAAADPGYSSPPSRFSGSFETVTGLVRN